MVILVGGGISTFALYVSSGSTLMFTMGKYITCFCILLLGYIYFDFDQFNLSEVSKDKIKKFLNNYGSVINEYLVVGHTDTKGTNKYNLSLSIKRAEVVKEILINYGIKQNSIKILGKGEESLAVNTPDDTKQPANRRVEIKKTN